MKATRNEDRRLLHDLIAQATVDNEQGRASYSKKLNALMDRVLSRMGHTGPSRVNLEGLEDLLTEAAEDEPGDARHFPLVFRTSHGVVWRWVTIDVEAVSAFGDEAYRAAVITLHEE